MNKLLLGLVAGAAGVAALVIGLFSNHWVVGREFGIDTHVGLRSMELCQVVQPELSRPGERVCSVIGHGDIANSPSAVDGFDTFSLVSRATFYTGLACGALVLLLMLLAVARRFPDLPVSPATLAIVLSFGTVVLVAVTLGIHPWKKLGTWGTGWAIMVTGGGAVACLFAAIMLGRLRPPVDDSWG